MKWTMTSPFRRLIAACSFFAASNNLLYKQHERHDMNSYSIGDATLTITDPVTGEKHTIGRGELRSLVAEIATHAPEGATEFAEVPQELREFMDGSTSAAVETAKPPILEVGERRKPAPTLRALNRKERRAQEKKRRSKVFQKAEAKRLDGIRKQMQAQYDAQRQAERDAEALLDVPFADPRNIGKIAAGFAPVMKAIDALQDGVVACMPDGTPLYFEAEDGIYYPAVDCLRAVVETFAKLGHVHGWSNHNAGLSHLANLLEADKPIHQKDIDAARKTIEWMKYCMLTITPRQFAREVVEVQIKAETTAQGLSA